MDAFLALEIVNVGDHATSLEPEIIFHGFDQHRNEIHGVFNFEQQDRLLDPHVTKEFTAVARIGADYFFTVYQTYKIKLTRGSGKTLRYRSISFVPISRGRFFIERLLFKVFGWFPDEQ
jgi:hypothetical protein